MHVATNTQENVVEGIAIPILYHFKQTIHTKLRNNSFSAVSSGSTSPYSEIDSRRDS